MNKIIFFITLFCIEVFSAAYYIRADGSATKDNATGPSTDPTKCMTVTTHNAATFNVGDTVFCDSSGGTNLVNLIPPSNGVYYKGIGKCKFSGAKDISTASYSWTKSANGINEFYCRTSAGGNPSLSTYNYLWKNDIKSVLATIGSLKYNDFAYGDNDALGYSTYYVRCDDGDPDTSNALIEISQNSYCFILPTTRTGVTVDGLCFDKSNDFAGSIQTACTTTTFKNCTFSRSFCVFRAQSGNNLKFYNCTFEKDYGTYSVYPIGSSFDSTGFYFCKFYDFAGYFIQPAITATAKIDILNCTFYGCGKSAIYQSATNTNLTTNIYNSIFIAYGFKQNECRLAWSLAGTVNIGNSYLQKNGRSPQYYPMFTGVTDQGGNISTGMSGIAKPKTKPWFSLTSDDNTTLLYWDSLSHLANSKSIPLTHAMYTGDDFTTAVETSVWWDTANSFVSRGNQIECHTMSHPQLDIFSACSVQYVGAGSAATITIVNDSLKTTVTDGPGGENIAISLTSSNYRLFYQVHNYIDGLAAYTCKDAYSADRNDISLSRYYKAVSAQDIKTSKYVVLLDTNSWLNYEIKQSKEKIEDSIPGYTVKSIFYPYGNVGEKDISYSMDSAGINNGRMTSTANPFYVNNYDAMKIYSWFVDDDLYNANRDSSLSNIYAAIQTAGFVGGPCVTYQHGAIGNSSPFCSLLVFAVDSAQRSGHLKAENFSSAMDSLFSHSVAFKTATDSARWWWYNKYDSSDLRLVSNSTLRDTGSVAKLSGIPNLIDMDGEVITNSSGLLQVGSVNLGAYGDWPYYTIDTTGRFIGNGTWTIAGGLTQDSGVTVVYSASPASGWAFVRYGGTFTGTSATDSYVIAGNHTDSVIFSIKPIILSFTSKRKRDVDWDFIRVGDTGTLKFSTNIGDSTAACTTWINRGRTIIAPMIGWFNTAGTDSIQIVIPGGVPPNYYYRSKVKNRYGIMNDDPTAHTMHVIGRVD
jgi:hypothetical protein